MKTGLIVAMDSEFRALRAAGIGGVRLSGIGKVNAAMSATEMILQDRPDCIINSGVAGSLSRPVASGDMVIASRVAYHDVWCGEPNDFGQVQGLPRFFDADPALLDAAASCRMDGTHVGLVCTGDQFFISTEEDARILRLYPDALACDMESAAIAQVCARYGVPFLSFRMISDVHDDEHTQRASYADFWKNLSGKSFGMLARLLEKI